VSEEFGEEGGARTPGGEEEDVERMGGVGSWLLLFIRRFT
jgi:general stress protein YciG